MKVIPEHNILATDQWFVELTNNMWCFGNYDITNNIFWSKNNKVLCEKDTLNKMVWISTDIWDRFNTKYNYDFQKTQDRLNELVSRFGWDGYKCYCNITDIEDRWSNVRIPELMHI